MLKQCLAAIHSPIINLPLYKPALLIHTEPLDLTIICRVKPISAKVGSLLQTICWCNLWDPPLLSQRAAEGLIQTECRSGSPYKRQCGGHLALHDCWKTSYAIFWTRMAHFPEAFSEHGFCGERLLPDRAEINSWFLIRQRFDWRYRSQRQIFYPK